MKKRWNQALALVACLAVAACSASNKTDSEVAGYPEDRLGWKIGSQAFTFRLFTLAETIDKIDSADLRYLEAFPGQAIGGGSGEKMNHSLSAEGRAFVKNLLKEKNVTLHAFGVTNGQDAEEWEKIFAFAKDMGVQVINCEPEEEHLDIVSALCDKYDIKAGIHNHPAPSHYWNPEVVLKALEGRSPRMGATADLGHWMRSGLDPVECLKKLDGKVIHLHFKDLNAFGEMKAHDVHWGTGELPIGEVVEELKRQRFDGMLSAEYEHNWENNKDDVKQSVANLREML